MGNAETREGERLPSGRTPPSLSEGRIAFARRGEQESIDVLNLQTGSLRTIAIFTGSERLERIALVKSVVAWAEQGYAYQSETYYNYTSSGARVESYSCVGLFT